MCALFFGLESQLPCFSHRRSGFHIHCLCGGTRQFLQPSHVLQLLRCCFLLLLLQTAKLLSLKFVESRIGMSVPCPGNKLCGVKQVRLALSKHCSHLTAAKCTIYIHSPVCNTTLVDIQVSLYVSLLQHMCSWTRGITVAYARLLVPARAN